MFTQHAPLILPCCCEEVRYNACCNAKNALWPPRKARCNKTRQHDTVKTPNASKCKLRQLCSLDPTLDRKMAWRGSVTGVCSATGTAGQPPDSSCTLGLVTWSTNRMHTSGELRHSCSSHSRPCIPVNYPLLITHNSRQLAHFTPACVHIPAYTMHVAVKRVQQSSRTSCQDAHSQAHKGMSLCHADPLPQAEFSSPNGTTRPHSANHTIC